MTHNKDIKVLRYAMFITIILMLQLLLGCRPDPSPGVTYYNYKPVSDYFTGPGRKGYYPPERDKKPCCCRPNCNQYPTGIPETF